MKKLIALVTVIATVLTLMACAANKNDGTSTTTTPESTGQQGLPEANYRGRSYRVSLQERNVKYEFYVAEDSTDILENAMFIRNETVQDRYNVVIEPIPHYPSSLHSHVEEAHTLLLTDNDEFDIITPYVCSVGPLILDNLLVDWNSLKYTDLDASYWIQSINDKNELQGHIYNPVGSTNTTALLYTYTMMMNKKLAENEEIYDEVISKVQSGEWTMDYFSTLISGIYNDIDDVKGRSADDYYGFQAENLTNLDMYPFAFDIPYLQAGDDETLEYVFGQGDYRDKLVNAANMIHELYWENGGSYIHTTAGYEQTSFMSDRAVFSTINFRRLIDGVKDMESPYTVLPYPKYDENQEDYLTGMGDNYTMCCMPITVSDRDFVSHITEALNAEAEKVLYPAYYESAIKTKYQDDPVSYDMIDLIMKGRTSDLGVVFMEDLSGLPTMFRAAIMFKNNDIVQRLDSTTDQIVIKVEEIVESYLASASN